MNEYMFYVAIGMPVATFLVGLLWYLQRERREARQPTPKELIDVMQATHRKLIPEVEELRERVERLEAAFKSFRGQVYAWRGKLDVETPAASEPPPPPSNLADPRLSKAQVKAALNLNTPAGVAAFLKSKQ